MIVSVHRFNCSQLNGRWSNFESSKNYIPIIFGSSKQTQKWDKVTILGYPITSTNRTGQPQIYPLETTLIEINANRGKGYDMS